jgi:hypothetical protein
MNIEYITEQLQPFLLRNISVKCNNKILKSGKLKLFNIKQFFIKLHLENAKKEIKVFEIPYPFKVNAADNNLTFNYHLSSLYGAGDFTHMKIKMLKSDTTSKMYNNIVNITG